MRDFRSTFYPSSSPSSPPPHPKNVGLTKPLHTAHCEVVVVVVSIFHKNTRYMSISTMTKHEVLLSPCSWMLWSWRMDIFRMTRCWDGISHRITEHIEYWMYCTVLWIHRDMMTQGHDRNLVFKLDHDPHATLVHFNNILLPDPVQDKNSNYSRYMFKYYISH